ncbi:MAG: DUF58 domain-containing protein [Acidimicrobiales bacterium]
MNRAPAQQGSPRSNGPQPIGYRPIGHPDLGFSEEPDFEQIDDRVSASMTADFGFFAVPTGRMVVLVAAASLVVAATSGSIGTWAYGNLFLVLLGFIDVARTVVYFDLRFSRQMPAVVALGSPAEVVWTVANASKHRPRLAVADDLAPSLGASSRRVTLSVPPRGAASTSIEIRPRRRGRFTPTRVAVRVRGPMGLMARQGHLSMPQTVRVYPRFSSRAQAELRVQKARLLTVGLRTVRGRGSGTDFDSLRDYTPDDDFRRMDWAATARSGRAIVRTYRPERNQTVMVLLDTGRTMAGQIGFGGASGTRLPGGGAPRAGDAGPGGAGGGAPDLVGAAPPRLDHAMDAAMALTLVGTRLGDRVGMVAFDSVVRAVVPPATGTAQLGRVTEAMHELEPRLVESDYREAFLATMARSRRRCLIVLLSDLTPEPVAETLLPALGLVASRHLVVVVGVIDPEIRRWAQAVPTDATSAYRKAAAVASLAARMETADRLRARGATVLDAPPEALAARLADTYLELKATGRL